MFVKKAIKLIAFIVITLALIRSRLLLSTSDYLLSRVGDVCRNAGVNCTGEDYGLALMLSSIIVNAVIAFVILLILSSVYRHLKVK